MDVALFGRSMLTEWPLDPDVTYLNHGTVGVTPRRVLAAQQDLRDEIERQPSAFILRELTAIRAGRAAASTPRLRQAAAAVAEFLGASGDDLVFVDNATTGAVAVLRSFPFQPGDEILVSDFGYGGVTLAATFAARERGATVKTVALPYPVDSSAAIVEAFTAAAGPATKLAIVDHIAAQTAIVMPLAEIAAGLQARGVAVLADGAHAPGSIPFSIAALGVDWYVGNLHKWMWTPRSSAVLWAAPARQRHLHPPVISWGLDQGFTTEFDAPGTRDPSAHLSAPAAIAWFHKLGVDAVQSYNHALAWNAGHRLAVRLGTAFTVPEALVGTMATVPLPRTLGTTADEAVALRDTLLYNDRIEVPVFAFRGQLHTRISAQLYNELADVDRLADALSRRL